MRRCSAAIHSFLQHASLCIRPRRGDPLGMGHLIIRKFKPPCAYAPGEETPWRWAIKPINKPTGKKQTLPRYCLHRATLLTPTHWRRTHGKHDKCPTDASATASHPNGWLIIPQLPSAIANCNVPATPAKGEKEGTVQQRTQHGTSSRSHQSESKRQQFCNATSKQRQSKERTNQDQRAN